MKRSELIREIADMIVKHGDGEIFVVDDGASVTETLHAIVTVLYVNMKLTGPKPILAIIRGAKVSS